MQNTARKQLSIMLLAATPALFSAIAHAESSEAPPMEVTITAPQIHPENTSDQASQSNQQVRPALRAKMPRHPSEQMPSRGIRAQLPDHFGQSGQRIGQHHPQITPPLPRHQSTPDTNPHPYDQVKTQPPGGMPPKRGAIASARHASSW